MPRNAVEGRDHWPDAGFALFAGGGLRMGQVVGETDGRGARPKSRALGAQNVLGTLYHALGIDPSRTIPAFSGRPMRLLDDGDPIAELIEPRRGSGRGEVGPPLRTEPRTAPLCREHRLAMW